MRNANPLEPAMKWMKRIFFFLSTLFFLLLLSIGATIAWADYTDYAPAPVVTLKQDSPPSLSQIDKDTLSFFNWNIGFCGLGEESDFFYDGGQHTRMEAGIVEKNYLGILDVLKSYQEEADFFLLQEVDRNSKRSYYNDQVAGIIQRMEGYGATFAKNFQVDFIPLPIQRPMGKVSSGLLSLSRYQAELSERHAFKGNYDWPNNLFFLDRCFLVERFPTQNGKSLWVINTHNSAYDNGNLRIRQMTQLKQFLKTLAEKGDYVIVGGDWNQVPANYQGLPDFPATPNTLSVPVHYPDSTWTWAYDPQTASNRSLEVPLSSSQKRSVIDYYLLSPNVELLQVNTLDLGFKYSDHQPIQLQVALKTEAEH